jgi:hypothetical protein
MDELCKGPKTCPDTREVSCRECGDTWVPADLMVPGKCPGCGSQRFVREYCDECPNKYLEKHSNCLEYQLMRRAIDVQNALVQDCRFQVTLNDVTMEEYIALKVLRREQVKAMDRKRANQNSQ